MPYTNENLILNRYQKIETAGEGGSGTVIHAYDTRLKREVAIKVIDVSNKNDSESNNRENLHSEDDIPGLSEARAAGKLASANIVTVYDCEVCDGKAYVIEEYVEGITLTTLMHYFQEQINLDIIAHVFKSVSSAIMTAHKENILHLDIKPDNILIGRGGEVKVADFGLATLMDLNGEGATTSGTIGYMSMEQMECAPLDVRSDEWALACVIYEMLSGSNPFACVKTVQDAKATMISAELIVPSVCWEDLDDEADDVLFKALNVDRDVRYASIRQFYGALKPHLGDPRVGKKSLSVIVNGNDDKFLDTSTIENLNEEKEIRKPDFLIDRLGSKGVKIIGRLLMSFSVVAILFFVFLNVNQSSVSPNGLIESQPIMCFVFILAGVLFSFLAPRYAVLIPFIAVEILFNTYSAWGIMAFYAISFFLWWSWIGRKIDESSICISLAMILGGLGLTPVAVALLGAIHNVKDAIVSCFGVFAQSLVFACLSTKSVFNWNILSFFFQVSHSNIYAGELNDAFLVLFLNPKIWLIGCIWVVAVATLALFCKKGTKGLSVVGSFLFLAIMLTSSFVPFLIEGEQVDVGEVVSVVVAGAVALVLSLSSFTNRIRLESWEW